MQVTAGGAGHREPAALRLRAHGDALAVGFGAGGERLQAAVLPALHRLVHVAVGTDEQHAHVELRLACEHDTLARALQREAVTADLAAVEQHAEVPVARGGE